MLRALKYILGTAALGILLYFTDIRAVVASLSSVTYSDILILTAISFALIAVSVVKWRAFLLHLGIAAGFWRLFGLYLVGYFVNLVMPSYVGGDVVRSMYVAKDTNRAAALSATILERYTGVVAMLLIALVCVWWAPNVTPQILLLTLLLSTGMLVCTLLMFSRKLSAFLGRLPCPKKVLAVVHKVEDGLVLGISDRTLLLKASVLSLAFHILTVVNTAAVAVAVGWDNAPWGDLFVVVPLILLVGAIPISPQGLGIQEGAFLFFLHSIGASPAQALGVGLVLRAKSYILAIFGGLIWISNRPSSLQGNETTFKS